MKKFLNYKFLMTVLASVVVLLEVLMDVFKIKLNIEAVISVSVAIIGVMVTIGVVDKDKSDKDVKTKDDLKDFMDETKIEENKTRTDEDNKSKNEVEKSVAENLEELD